MISVILGSDDTAVGVLVQTGKIVRSLAAVNPLAWSILRILGGAFSIAWAGPDLPSWRVATPAITRNSLP